MKLSEYILRRNGVPIGHNSSLKNMLNRSLGAGTFAKFWLYWNPIWGYFLSNYCLRPLKLFLPSALSLILTFAVSGCIHDLVITILKSKFTFLLTPWFILMGICVVLGDYAKVDYSKFPWVIRAIINLVIISGCLLMAHQIKM